MNSPKISNAQRTALREKYALERGKRIRPDGVAQYLSPTGKFSQMEDDPYLQPKAREPITDHFTFVMIGGGFAGLCVGARLREKGIEDFRIIEGGGDFGGVWYWNRYPGAMCDTAAMVYLPLLEETGHMPSQKYVMAPEIWNHAKRIGHHFELYQNAIFSTHVDAMIWDDDAKHWIITTNRGDRMTAKYISMGTGPLNRPKLPGIDGIDTFAGHMFHTSRWDYSYTGGSYEDPNLANLANKRVGVIGTGATAIQCVPPLGRHAEKLFVFQRTPSAVDERNNHVIDSEWFESLEPGWQKKWLLNFATLQTGGFADEDLVHDGWTDIAQRIRDRMVEIQNGDTTMNPENFLRAYEESDDEKTQEIRSRVDALVADSETAENLKAWYRQFCKRPCFHDEYLQTFNQDNVFLVDTDGQGVTKIDETGVWVGDKHYDLDCIIFASGFDFNTDYTHRSEFEVTGRDGLTLTQKWADGMETYHGMHVHQFPNMFIMGLFQGANLGANVTSNYTDASITLAEIIHHAEKNGHSEIEVDSIAEQLWVKAIEDTPASFIGGNECTPGYYNNEGQSEGRRQTLNMGGYPLGPVAFFEYIEEWRSSGDFQGLSFR